MATRSRAEGGATSGLAYRHQIRVEGGDAVNDTRVVVPVLGFGQVRDQGVIEGGVKGQGGHCSTSGTRQVRKKS